MAISRSEFKDALQHLNITDADLATVQKAKSYEDATAVLDALKKKAHQQFKKAAVELHPDMTGNDPVKTDLFKRLSNAMDCIRQLSVKAAPKVDRTPTCPDSRVVHEQDPTSERKMLRHP